MVQQLRHIQVVKLVINKKKIKTIGLNWTKYLSPSTSSKICKNDKFKLSNKCTKNVEYLLNKFIS